MSWTNMKRLRALRRKRRLYPCPECADRAQYWTPDCTLCHGSKIDKSKVPEPRWSWRPKRKPKGTAPKISGVRRAGKDEFEPSGNARIERENITGIEEEDEP